MTAATLLLCPFIGLLALLWARRGFDSRESTFVTFGFLAHAFGAIAIVIYHDDIYKGGDMWWYTLHGQRIAELLRRDLTGWAPDVFKLAFHQENHLPVTVLLEGTSTGTMSAIAGFVLFATGGSVYGACLLISTFAFVGSVSLYRSFRPELSEAERPPVIVGTLLVPSAVFWTSGIVKEAIVLGGLGMLCLGLTLILRWQLRGFLGVIIGATAISIIKPYVLFAVVLAFAGSFYARRQHRFSWASKLFGLLVAISGTVMMTRWFPEFGLERIAETMARSQYNFTTTGGGSNIDLGVVDDDAIERTSLAAQLKYVPLALLNVFARPVLFDVRNVSQGIAALEMTVVVVIALGLLRRLGLRRAWTEIRAKRWSTFCVVFVLVFAPPVGLATGNLGTLSRYRVPMMPMYAAALLALRARVLANEREKNKSVFTKVAHAPRAVTRAATRSARIVPRKAAQQ